MGLLAWRIYARAAAGAVVRLLDGRRPGDWFFSQIRSGDGSAANAAAGLPRHCVLLAIHSGAHGQYGPIARFEKTGDLSRASRASVRSRDAALFYQHA